MTSPPNADFVTRHEFELAISRLDSRFDRLEGRLDVRLAQVDGRFAESKGELDGRFGHVDSRFAELKGEVAEMKGGLAELKGSLAELKGDLEAQIERAMVASIRWTVGVSFGLYALMFALILFVVSRELPHA